MKLGAIAAAAVFLAAISGSGAMAHQTAGPLFQPFQGVDGLTGAELGEITVAENRGDPASRQIAIRFVRLRSTADHPGAPIVYLAGGPGGSGIDVLRSPRGDLLRRLRAVADVIALDQRGTGLSNAIPPCAPDNHLDMAHLTGAAIAAQFRAGIEQCLEQWRSAGVDPAGYDLLDSAEDLEALRISLGAEQLSLLGISYGPQLGMAYMKLHPERVARAVFASPRGLDQTLRLPADIDAFLQRVLDPDTIATMRRVHARLDAEPVSVTLTPRGATEPVTIGFDSFAVRYLTAFYFLNSKAGVDQIPALYHQMDEGRFDTVAGLILENGLHPQRGRFVAFRGMGELMDISSNASPERLAVWRSQVADSLLGDAHGFPMPQGLGLGDLDIPADFKTPLISDTPTMFVSATHDGRTPREEVDQVLHGFSHGALTVVENGGHNVFEQSQALQAAIVAFLQDGTAPPSSVDVDAP